MYVPSNKSCEFSGKFMCPVAVVKSSVSKSSNAFTASHSRTVLSIEPKREKVTFKSLFLARQQVNTVGIKTHKAELLITE